MVYNSVQEDISVLMNYIPYFGAQNKIKVIPTNIYDLLTPIALANWIRGDGAKRNKGLVLCTDSYSILDVVKISNVLRIKYDLKTTITGFKNNRPRIYVLPESMPNLCPKNSQIAYSKIFLV